MNTEGIHSDPKLPGVGPTKDEPTKLTEDLHRIIADGKHVVSTEPDTTDETVVLFDVAGKQEPQSPKEIPQNTEAKLAEIQSAADIYQRAIITDLERLSVSTQEYRQYQAEITSSVEDMLRQVNNRVDKNDQLDKMAAQIADDIATELIAQDRRGTVAGRTGKDKQLLHTASELDKSEETGKLGIYDRATLDIKDDFMILKAQTDLEQKAGVVDNGIRARLVSINRNIHQTHNEIDHILVSAAADTDGRLRQFRELRYYQDQTEYGNNKSEAVVALIQGVEEILRTIENVKTKARKKALIDEAMIYERHKQGADLSQMIVTAIKDEK